LPSFGTLSWVTKNRSNAYTQIRRDRLPAEALSAKCFARLLIGSRRSLAKQGSEVLMVPDWSKRLQKPETSYTDVASSKF
jgi:hypothetical protein